MAEKKFNFVEWEMKRRPLKNAVELRPSTGGMPGSVLFIPSVVRDGLGRPHRFRILLDKGNDAIRVQAAGEGEGYALKNKDNSGSVIVLRTLLPGTLRYGIYEPISNDTYVWNRPLSGKRAQQ